MNLLTAHKFSNITRAPTRRLLEVTAILAKGAIVVTEETITAPFAEWTSPVSRVTCVLETRWHV